MTNRPLTRLDLDGERCMVLNCRTPHPHPLILHALCHPSAHLETTYFGGVLTFRCVRCLTVITQIAVAEGRHQS